MTEQLLLETALAELEAGVDAALGNASTLVRHLKKLRSVAQSGDLREISKVLGEITQSTGEVAAATSALAFEFDTNSYFPEKYLRELEAAAKERGLSAFPRDGKLYCYPLLVRIKAAERVVEIGRRTERGIRPSALAATLQKLQSKPTRFKPCSPGLP